MEKRSFLKERFAMKYIRWFKDISIDAIPEVGGKNASLGEMISQLSTKGLRIPNGFAVTAQAFRLFITHNNLGQLIQDSLAQVKIESDLALLQKIGTMLRTAVAQGSMPKDLETEIITAYDALSKEYGVESCDVAVRSSATAEDLPTASFAGQQETFLNISGHESLIDACKKSMASLFTDRAIVYRLEQGFAHDQVALSIGVQKMIRSDKASSGTAFSLDTESGFKDVVMIDAAYGLGESIVQGVVVPDEFLVHKPTLAAGFTSIVKKQLGDKREKMVYDGVNKTAYVPVSAEEQQEFSLTDSEILALARDVVIIEKHYSERKGVWTPMDVEWAKDGDDGKLYILQARPETIHGSAAQRPMAKRYELALDPGTKILATGLSIGQRIASGTVRLVKSVSEIAQVMPGDILVTEMTDPDWVPVMKKVAGIITERGGRTCHAAIVSRELGIPAIVGAVNALTLLKSGMQVTMDCSRGERGTVYEGLVPYTEHAVLLDKIPTLPFKLMVNIGDPEQALSQASLPVDGVGLARSEFIISNAIKVHPMALVKPERVEDEKTREQIDEITVGYVDKTAFFVDVLARNVGLLAAAFYPKPVIVRLSDFKTNEYRNLIGGQYFESVEENPMLGFRGASRYCHEQYKEAFALECAALLKVRHDMGFKNVEIMVPFVRTTGEAHAVLVSMQAHGLKRGVDGLRIIMMCEIPSNVLLIDDFAKIFDGFSIGSNDLTQLTLGVDRDSALVAPLFDERDPAVKKLLVMAVEGAKRNNVYSGICGQAPSDYPEIAELLIQAGIDSLSLNADAILPFLQRQEVEGDVV
jgi:pyruvate,water dikinase